MKAIIQRCLVIVMTFAFTACDSSDDPGDTPVKPDSYCLMFYMSGGDAALEKIENGYKEAISKKLANSNVEVTWLMQPAGTGSAVTRSYSSDNSFKVDETWSPATGYDITSPSSLTEFIDWSARMFPDRKYILVTGGHGGVWTTTKDNPLTKALIQDGSTGKMMTTTNLARGIENSSVQIAALITNNCLQGCIETLSEWQDCVSYCVCTPSYLPDLGGDYPYLMSLLDRQTDIRQILAEYVRHIGMYLTEYGNDTTGVDIAVCAVDMSRIKQINETLKVMFAEMTQSLERTSALTDWPCVAGRSYAKGYMEAMKASLHIDKLLGQPRTTDLYDFLKNAVVYTGHIELMSLLEESLTAYNSAVLMSARSSVGNGHIISFNILTDRLFYDNDLDVYRSNRFDQQTAWSTLYEKMLAIEND